MVSRTGVRALNIPLPLEPESTVLVAGAGGGYDVLCALPVALALREAGHKVHLASYSFSKLSGLAAAESPMKHLYAVSSLTEDTESGYFPEAYVARWWKDRFKEEITVWSYHKVGVRPLSRIFAHLCVTLKINAVVILDAGVDGLFEGSEHELGTPSIDAISILAAAELPEVGRYFAFTAFGTEGRNHSVRHADALLRISQQLTWGGMLGVSALLPTQNVGKYFLDAVEFVHTLSGPAWYSNMASSIVAAMKGKFGHQHLTVKTAEAPIWVSPLTLLYWFFDLETIAQAKPFRERALGSETIQEVVDIFRETRERSPILPRLDIPI